MSFDPVACAMGRAGAGRDAVSALMGEAGGVPGTLEESGWIRSTGGNAVVSGSEIRMPEGSAETKVELAPPTALRESGKFIDGDELVMSIVIKSLSSRLRVSCDYGSRASVQSKNDKFTWNAGRGYTAETGADELTWNFTGNMIYISFFPWSSAGAASSEERAELFVRGLAFNGTTIFGRV